MRIVSRSDRTGGKAGGTRELVLFGRQALACPAREVDTLVHKELVRSGVHAKIYVGRWTSNIGWSIGDSNP